MLGQDQSRQHATWSSFTKPLRSIMSVLPSCKIPHRYVPLEKDQIRLLKLWPGERTTQIRCSLHVVSLRLYDDRTGEFPMSALPSYDAVSYVWGKCPKTEEIICDNRNVRITANLANALHSFRRSGYVSVLWVDALCINQKDLDERAKQVQLMGLIFFKARRVRIWLGLDDEPVYSAGRAATLIRRFAGPYRTPRRVSSRSLSEAILGQHRETDNVNWKALQHLLAREWFKRVWVVQEIGLSRDATFYCGKIQITRQELYDFVYLLEHSKSGLLQEYDIDLLMLRLGQQYRNATWDHNRVKLGSSPDEAETFLDLLSKTRGLKCTDQRDSIFAFLGHPSAFKKQRLDDGPYRWYPRNYYDGSSPIVVPNYDESVTFSWVCIDLAVKAVKDRGLGLQLLAHIAHDQGTIEMDVPSWVPLWNVLTQSSHFHGFDKFYHASASLEATSISIYASASNPYISRMIFRGLKLAHVRYTTTKPATLSVQSLVETLFPERTAGSSYLKQHTLDWPAAISRTRNSANDWSALALTLTAGLITTGTHRVPVAADPHLSRQVAGMESFLGRYGREPLQIQCCRDEDIAQYFHMDLGRAAHSRIFYVTSHGGFGLAPMITQEGDQVWLPLGATMPFILRPLSQGVFKILGQTYLHGVMNGEGVNEESQRRFQTVILC